MAEAVREPPRDPSTNQFTFRGTVVVEGVPARDLLARARTWGMAAYHPFEEVVGIDPRGQTTLTISGACEVASSSGPPLEVRHILTIELLDGAYHYAITDLRLASGRGSPDRQALEDAGVGGAERAALLAGVRKGLEKLVYELTHAMAAP
jgi:hypothetical protein